MNQVSLARLFANLMSVLVICKESILLDILPPSLIQLEWNLNATVAMSNVVTVPRAGVAFVHRASDLSP